MREEGLSSILLVDGKRNLQGYVMAEDALEATNQEIRDLHQILKTDIQKVEKDTPMNEIFDIIYDSPIPVAVVTDDRLEGIIEIGRASCRERGDIEGMA